MTPEGTLVWTLTSNGYKFLTLNLVEHLRRAKVPWRLCVICADAASYSFFQREGIPCRKLLSLVPDTGVTQPSLFGSRTFQVFNRKKLEILADLTALERVRVGVYLDSDIVVYRDFLPDLLSRLAASPTGLLFQCDEQTRVDCSRTSGCGCTGFLAWRHGAAPPELFQIRGEEAIALWKRDMADQPFVNGMCALRGVALETLPRDLYPNGMFASQFRGATPAKEKAFLLHYNWIVGESKRLRMKNNEDWLLPY